MDVSGTESALLSRIGDGSWPPGVRLPPERELAAEIGTSRVTLRQALGRIESLGLVERRRGSGVRVRASEDWSFQALPVLLATSGAAVRPAWVVEALALRRAWARQALTATLDRLAAADVSRTRSQIARAFAAREHRTAFVREDALILGTLLAAAEAWPARWLWNDWTRLAEAVAARGREPIALEPRYEEHQEEMLVAIADADRVRAERRLAAHLSQLDRSLLEPFTPSNR